MLIKKLFLFCCLLLAIALPASGQSYTAVTGTATDINAAPYVGGSLTASFVNTTGQQALFGGNPNFQKTYSAPLDSTGSFTLTLPSNAAIAPTGTQWSFTACTSDGENCFSASVTISGASQSISASLINAIRITFALNEANQPPCPVGQTVVAVSGVEYGCSLVATPGGNIAFTGNNSASAINSIISVDGTKYTRDDTGVQAALTALHAQGGGVLNFADGTYSPLTSTITLNCKETLSVGVINKTGTYQLLSSANPVINMTGTGNGSPDCGTVLTGVSRFGSMIIGTGGATADVVNISANCSGCKIEEIRLGGQTGNSRDTIRIQDGQRNLVFRNMTLGPNAECINYIPGGSGFNLIEIDSVRCDGWTGSGMDFRLNGFANGTNLLFTNTYLANGLSSPVSYDVNGLQASFNSTADDRNVANAIGYRFGTTASNRGCYELRNVQAEGTALASQTGIQISGAACVVMISPYINADGTPISISAASTHTTIINPVTSATANTNSIVYGASVTGQHILLGKTFLDKAILNSSTAIVEEHEFNYTLLPGSLGLGLSNGSAPSFNFEIAQGGTSNTLIGFDRGGAFKWRMGNEGTANGVCGLSAQDDFCIRGAAGTVNFSTDGGTTDALRVNNTNLTIQGAPIPRTAGSVDIGSTSLPWGNLWLGTAATNNFKFQPATAAAARTIVIPDFGVSSATMTFKEFAQSWSAIQTFAGGGIGSIKVDRIMAVGTAPTCTFTSGGGTTPSCALDTGSTDSGGIIVATTGTGAPAALGTITLTFSATFGTNKPSCVYIPSDNGAGQWNARATMMDKTPATGSDLFNWDNNGTTLALSTAFWINYHCFAK